MEEQQTPKTQESSSPNKPQWLQGMTPQVELVRIWSDVYETDCTCDICKRLRKALSEIKTPPTGGPVSPPQS